MGFQTDCTLSGEDRGAYQGAAAPPIHSASTFTFDSYAAFAAAFGPGMEGYGDTPVYTRGNNPTVQVLERKVALLEGADEGRAFGSGMAAIAAAVLSAAKAGDHVVAVQSVYANAFRLLKGYLPKLGITTTFADFTDLQCVRDAITDRTTVLYLESPGNPAMDIVDVPAIAAIAREHGLVTIIDNTMATPFNQRPIALGIDLVVHSATKYLAGHGDVVAGIVVGSSQRMRAISGNEIRDLGGIMGPFEAWLVLRGIRTLGLRMRAHNEAGMQLACQLVEHPRVQKVLYPGLRAHPQHDLARRQMSGFGGMLTVVLEGGMEAAIRFADNLHLFGIAVSWGGFESLVLPINPEMTHSPEICSRLGIVPGMVRLSVGLEDIEDLQLDLTQALRATFR